MTARVDDEVTLLRLLANRETAGEMGVRKC